MSDWPMRRLDEVCEVIRGSSPRPIKQYLTDADDGVNWVKIGDATRNGKYITSTKQKITPKGAERSRKVAPGDLLLSNSMSYGQAYIMGIHGYVHDGWFVLRNFDDVFELEFLYNVLISSFAQKQFGILAAGAVVKNISSDLVKKAILPVPPKAEQKRIVAILDEAFGAIDRAKEIAAQNVANARELFESYLNRVFSEKGEGWEETSLGDVCDFQNGFAFKSKTFKSDGTPVLRISNIQGGSIDTKNVVFIDAADYEKDLTPYEVLPGELLIAMSGGTTGKIGINDTETTFLQNQRVGKFVPKKNLNRDFLSYFLLTKVEESLRIAAGAAQPNLSTAQIKAFRIDVPSIQSQESVVAKLDFVRQSTTQLGLIQRQKIAALDELKQSILQKAFTGQLTANSPELEAVP